MLDARKQAQGERKGGADGECGIKKRGTDKRTFNPEGVIFGYVRTFRGDYWKKSSSCLI